MATVLVIEDDSTTRRLIRMIIEERGHEVWEAANGVVGMMLARLLLPDLVVTDIVMSEKDGLETIMDLHENFWGAKIIALSAHPDKLERALRLGALAVFRKPFPPQELSEAVQEALHA